MDGKSVTPQEEKRRQLKEILPEAFSEGRIDWEKLKAALGEDVNFSSERYALNWAGKSDAFRVLQTPSAKTLIPVKSESVNFDETGHIFIEGENLEVLKILQRSYFGRVKMIYIDPPYNTGNDSFVYPDRFAESTEEYQKRIGEKDEDGYMTREGLFRKNSRENGQYHSNWLSMMYPRLFLAKNLLHRAGVIFVSIDDNEVHNLRLLMNEVFGEENFISEIIWKKKHAYGRGHTFIIPQTEYILCYAKNCENAKSFGITYSEDKINEYKHEDERGKYRLLRLWFTAPRGAYIRPTLQYKLYTPDGKTVDSVTGQWLWSEERMKKEIGANNVVFAEQKDGTVRAFKKDYLSSHEAEKPTSYYDVATTDDATREFNALLPEVKESMFTKPSILIGSLISWATFWESNDNQIILDFFAGSGTTAHAVMDLNKKDGGNRKFICVQLPEPCDEKSEAYKAGYKTIADIAKERIRRVIGKMEQDDAGLSKKNRIKKEEKAKQEFDLFGKNENPANPENQENPVQDLGFKVFRLADSNFKQWRSEPGKNIDVLQQQMMEFTDPLAPNATAENMVCELLLKSGRDLNSKVEHKHNCHCINSGELVLMLEKADEKTVDAVIRENPEKVIALDRLFEGNDQLKTNTALRMRDAGIEFKSI